MLFYSHIAELSETKHLQTPEYVDGLNSTLLAEFMRSIGRVPHPHINIATGYVDTIVSCYSIRT